MTLPRLCGMHCYLWYEAATQVAATRGNSFLQGPVWFRLQFENALLASVETSCLIMAHPALPKYTFPESLVEELVGAQDVTVGELYHSLDV